jgi:hypothetical protein
VASLVREARKGHDGAEPARPAGEFSEWGCDLEPGTPEEALAAYRDTLAAEPAHADAHFNAARLLEANGRKAEALRHLATHRRLMGA